jgi:hypothetical protein
MRSGTLSAHDTHRSLKAAPIRPLPDDIADLDHCRCSGVTALLA